MSPDDFYKSDQNFPAPFVSDIRWIWAAPGIVKLIFVERTEYIKEKEIFDTLLTNRAAVTLPWATLLQFRDYINKKEEEIKAEVERLNQVSGMNFPPIPGSKLN